MGRDRVDLALAEKRVVTSLEFVGRSAVCPECGATCPLNDHAPERHWRHLDTMQFEPVRNMATPWADPHSRFTLMFEAVAIDVLIAPSSVRVAVELLRLGWDSSHGFMERGLAVREVDGMLYVGLHGKSFGRGQSDISVMTDPDGSRVLEVVAGCTEKSAGQLRGSLYLQQREATEAVFVDMWQAFEDSAWQQAPQAEIVYDRFHIAKYLNEAVDQVRRVPGCLRLLP